MLGLGGCCGNTLQNIFREVKLKSLSMRQYSHLFMREFWIGLIEVGSVTLKVDPTISWVCQDSGSVSKDPCY